jgi:hypothetical protein
LEEVHMSESGEAQPIEVLSVARGRNLECNGNRPVVIVTIRPQPDRSWAYHHLSLSISQAKRLRDDLAALLKAPATFLLIAVLALNTGCSAKVELANEPAVAEANPAISPDAAVERSRTTVEVDLLGQRQAEPSASPVASEKGTPETGPMPSNTHGIQVNGDGNAVEFHYHRHRRSRPPVLVHPIVRHEMVIMPGDGSAPVVFLDDAPPRVVVEDEEVARAYAAHMLRLAREEHR